MTSKSLKKALIEDLCALYEEAVTLQVQEILQGDGRRANAQYKRIIAAWKELRSRGTEGEAALLRLMVGSNPHVRGWAASHVLEFNRELGEAELERLAHGPPSMVRLNAEMTLREWRAGRLTFPHD